MLPKPTLAPSGAFNYDQAVRDHYKNGEKGAVVGYLIMASYVYYVRISEYSILSDECFDKMMAWLGDNYDLINHRFKHLITKEDIKAGSLYALPRDKYPVQLIDIAEKLLQQIAIEENLNER